MKKDSASTPLVTNNLTTNPNNHNVENKPKNWTVIFLSISLITTLGITGFIGYKYYQLKQETSTTVNQPPILLTPTPLPSPTSTSQVISKIPFPSPGVFGSRSSEEQSTYEITQRSLPSWVTYLGRPPSKDLGESQSINLLPTTEECYNPEIKKNLELKLNQAFLINLIQDLPSTVYDEFDRKFPDIGHDKFLIIQGFVRNNATKVGTDWLYSDEYFRIKRPNSTYGGRTYGPTQVTAQSTAIFWTMFPIKPDEQQFTLLYCQLLNPIIISLNFKSSETVHTMGKYSATNGLYITP